MVLRVAGYKLTREEARKWALKTGGYEYNNKEGVWESGVIRTWFRYTPGMSELFRVDSYQWPQPKLPTDEGPPMIVFMERRRSYSAYDPLIETREDKLIKYWLLDNGLRGIVDDLEFLVISDPLLDEFRRKYGVPPPYAPETIALLNGAYTRICMPQIEQIRPLNSEDLFLKLEAAEAEWMKQNQHKAAITAVS